MNGTHKESAVSETIAIILIVALTVVLSSIVAVYALGIIGQLTAPQTLALTAKQIDENNIIVVYYGGPNEDSLVSLNITWPSGKTQTINAPKIGDTYSAVNPGNVTSGRDRVFIIGHFANNADLVVLDTYV